MITALLGTKVVQDSSKFMLFNSATLQNDVIVTFQWQNTVVQMDHNNINHVLF